ncbi:hypothetical protein [Virgibacillus salexigens]|uniref:hypothetical protein n=1 Tax=Virgibacillus salexigens TaxID=61016 RepID=UPI00190B3D1B|nr:hypothetical protein [Virgibacillus salexigens]
MYLKWTEESVEKAIFKVMETLDINRMPSNREMLKESGGGLTAAVNRFGGSDYWANKLNLEQQRKAKRWTDEQITTGIFEAIEQLDINRMPTANELIKNDYRKLDTQIKQTKKYSGWAAHLNLKTKRKRSTGNSTYKDSRNPKEYAVYRGDKLLFIDTTAKCAERLGVTINAFKFYTSNHHKERVKKQEKEGITDGIHVVYLGKESDYKLSYLDFVDKTDERMEEVI